jgi:hypothetical protein
VTDDLRQRYADALLNASLDGLKEFQTFATLRDAALFAADVVLAVRDEEMAALHQRAERAEAAVALHRPRTERPNSGCVQCGQVWPCGTSRMAEATDEPIPLSETLTLRSVVARVRTLAQSLIDLAGPEDGGPSYMDLAVADAGRQVLAALDEPEAHHE